MHSTFFALPLVKLISLLLLIFSFHFASAELSPSAVGWGNLFVPGLGATLRGYPGTGLTEAALEIGTYYGGSFGVREGGMTIDGSVKFPTKGNVYRPLVGQILQEFGFKYHFYNTFHHYQQASLALSESPREKENRQPLYQGTWKDILAAPFRWENIGSPWVYPVVLLSSAVIAYNYHHEPVQRVRVTTTPTSESLYGASQVFAIPYGGLIGEEPLFRGFIQREAQGYTDSVVASILMESTLFTLIHPNDLKATAFLSGLYYGYLVDKHHGNLEPGIAMHFWVNVVDGVFSYLLFRRAQGKNTAWQPPVTAQITIPF